MAKAKALDDEILGKLVYDRDLEWYEGRARLEGRSVELCVSAEGKLAVALARARVLVEDLARYADDSTKYAAKQLLALHNREWATGKPVTAAGFRDALRLRTIVVYEDRTAELTFAAGKLFRGHSITVSLNARGKPDDATI